jgi:NAD(P)-dependent dehydrogenase (short-subunit alcohol dehydrogenase family)
MRLDGELALVTGSTSGIGVAIARRFASEGARVVVTGRDSERGAETVASIVSGGGTASFVAADLSREDECTRLVAEARAALGGLTVLVNNAASGPEGGDAGVAAITTAAWERILTVNLTAPMWLTRAALPTMIEAGHGAIVNISTRQAEHASKGYSAYIASKAGLNGLTRSIAVEYAERGVRCNTISPGYVLNSRRDADLDAHPERRARLEAMHLSRLGTADDVAHLAVYLASHESDWLTGVNIPLDGGSSAARAASLG